MIEQKGHIEYKPEDVTPEARFYLVRMGSLFSVRDFLDTYPLTHYSAEVDGDGVATPQLRLAVGKAILGTYRMLQTLGFGYEARLLLQVHKGQHD